MLDESDFPYTATTSAKAQTKLAKIATFSVDEFEVSKNALKDLVLAQMGLSTGQINSVGS